MSKLFDAMKCVGLVGGMLAASVAMSACATDDAPGAATASDPIAEVSLDNGTKVMFFETGPGSIGIDQEAPLGVAPVSTAGLSAIEVFQTIAPGKPVPARLAEAQARVAAARSARPASKVARAATKQAAGAGTESFTSNWFETNYCYNQSGWSFINCYAGPLLTTDHSGGANDIDEFFVGVCVNSGKVTMRAYVEGTLMTAVQITDGFCHWYHWTSGLFNADNFQDTTTINSASGQYGLVVKYNH